MVDEWPVDMTKKLGVTAVWHHDMTSAFERRMIMWGPDRPGENIASATGGNRAHPARRCSIIRAKRWACPIKDVAGY